jgi:hypothetical protein
METAVHRTPGTHELGTISAHCHRVQFTGSIERAAGKRREIGSMSIYEVCEVVKYFFCTSGYIYTRVYSVVFEKVVQISSGRIGVFFLSRP